MDKRGISAHMLVVLLIGVVIILGSVMLFNRFFATLSDCDIQSVGFLRDVPKRIEWMALPSNYGSAETVSFRIPCGDKAYFLDTSKREELIASQAFDHEPLLKDAVVSDTVDNFFILDQDGIAMSFYMEGVRLDYPYHLCVDASQKRKVDLLLSGQGKMGVKTVPFCSLSECTSVPEVLSVVEIEKLVQTICEGEQACIENERFNIENAKAYLDVRLKVSACHPSATKIEFLIQPKEGIAAKGVKFFETVPKDCIADLRETLTSVHGGDRDVLIKPDPMLVWDFDAIREERQVGYHISKMLGDKCRKQLKAVASAELIVKEDYADVPIDQVTKEMLDPGFVLSLQNRGTTVPDGIVHSILKAHPERFYKEGLRSGWYVIEQGEIDDSSWDVVNTPPSIDFGKFDPQDKSRDLRFDTQDVFGRKVWEFSFDAQQQAQDLRFSMSKDSGSVNIDCDLLVSPDPRAGDIDCTVSGSSGERSSFVVDVEDAGNLHGSDMFEIVIP